MNLEAQYTVDGHYIKIDEGMMSKALKDTKNIKKSANQRDKNCNKKRLLWLDPIKFDGAVPVQKLWNVMQIV